MNTQVIKRFDWKHATLFVVTFLLATILGLWAWNTISALYSGPVAEYKHVIAVIVLLAILRWPFQQQRHRSVR